MRKIVSFFVIAFAISWLLWLPQVLDSNGWVRLPEWVGILGMFAPFGPFVAALWPCSAHVLARLRSLRAVEEGLKTGPISEFGPVWFPPA